MINFYSQSYTPFAPTLVFDYIIPCSIREKSLTVIDNNKTFTLAVIADTNTESYFSIFINAVENENEVINMTESFETSTNFGYSQHTSLPKGHNIPVKLNAPICLRALYELKHPKNTPFIQNKPFKMIVRMEPKIYPHRCVICYYFDLEFSEEVYIFTLVKHKVEIKENVYYLFEIYGLESVQNKGLLKEESVEQLCKICMDNVMQMIVLPCRHMCLCLECAKLYNDPKIYGVTAMKLECPVCRSVIKGFIQYKSSNMLSK